MVKKLDLLQPPNATARTEEQALELAREIGFPLVVRPSYVLGGRAMEIVYSEEELQRYMSEAVSVSNDSPVLLDRFLDDAVELDVDAICDGNEVYIGGIMEHIEQAGVHSGDSACSLPPYSLPVVIQERIKNQVREMAKELNVVGLMNTQFAVKDEEIFIIEVNPRASRTVPFVSKAIGKPLAKIAARCMVGKKLAEQDVQSEPVLEFYSVKEAVFPFVKFPGVDTLLGPEMKSTGEVMGVGRDFGEAFAKAQLGAGVLLPAKGKVFISVRDADKPRAMQIAKELTELGFAIVATDGTSAALTENSIDNQRVNKVSQGRPHSVDMIINNEIQFVINTAQTRQAIADSREMRKAALQNKVTYTTTIAGAHATTKALASLEKTSVTSLQELHKELAG
jgi:carbamoyl-phosphate synthase large subunit